ncbi:MAG: DUF1638 domain-containing protein [Alphaproteobacteria bacterium]|nr:DUF1638 domain-containing protein [Alphaproteobacteria bacterium]
MDAALESSPSAASRGDEGRSVLVLACGALAGELLELRRANGWDYMALRCLPAKLHNTPRRIPDLLRGILAEEGARGWGRIFIAYADCGMGAALEPVLKEYGVERLPGAHCYAFFRGVETFEDEHAREPTCFYLTDFLARHFDSLIWRGMGIAEHPELREAYFGNYTRLVFLTQTADDALKARAREAAARLGLEYEERHTGLGAFERVLAPHLSGMTATEKVTADE